jgi:1,4-alpha-glucan branching enzyme
MFGVAAPVFCPSGVAAFGRHPTTSKLVWSSIIGYPADFNYREYYRDIGFELGEDYLGPYQYAAGVRTHTGIKYHRITGKGEHKELYHPDWASDTAYKHACDFVDRCRGEAGRARQGMPMPSVIVSPYDAELFGHWWFEGPQWLYQVLKRVGAGNDDLAMSTPGEYLASFPIQQRATPAPSSWGKKGYNEHWINPKTEWMWRPLHEAAARMRLVVGRHPGQPEGGLADRALRQAGRELMLAQASDWPFIITNGTTEEYARRRFNDHLQRCHYLLQGVEAGQIDPEKLGALEQMDALFPELDYRLFA